MDGSVAEKVVKRKKSKPRFISVKPEELEAFMRDVNEYKQILRSIGMYSLCQNWKQKRDLQRNEEKEERHRIKISKIEDQKSLGTIGYNMKMQQNELFEFLGIDDTREQQSQNRNDNGEILQSDQEKHYVEYNKAYQNLHSQSDEKPSHQASKERKSSDDQVQLQNLQQTRSIDDGSREEVEEYSQNKDRNRSKSSRGLIYEALDKRKIVSSGISKKTKANIVNKSLKKSQFRSQENSDADEGIEHFNDPDNVSSHVIDPLSASRLSDTNNNNNKSALNRTRQQASQSDIDDDDDDDDEGEYDGDSLVQEIENEQDIEMYDEISEEQEVDDFQQFIANAKESIDEVEADSDSAEMKKEKKKKDKKDKKEKKDKNKKRRQERSLSEIFEEDIEESDREAREAQSIIKKDRKKKRNQ